MPGIAILTGTALVPAGTFPYSIVIGGVEVAPTKAALESIRIEDNADDEPGRLSVKVWDADNSLDLTDGTVCHVEDALAEVDVFLGTVQRRWHDAAAVGRYVNIEAISISAMLDETLVVRETRPVESDRARVLFLWGKYARWPLSGDPVFVTQTNASVAADDLINMTLRQALRQTAGLAGSTVRFGIDALGKLHWFAGTETNPAPFNLNVAQTPGGGNIAPDDLKIDRDGTIKNRAYVRGANAAGSGFYQDDLSVSQYGPRETFIDAPSADTAAKAQSIARLYFGRVAQPRTRGKFTTRSPNDGWRAGQNVTVTSPQEDMTAQAFRIVRVTTTFTKGTGTRNYSVEFGKVGARSSNDERDGFVPPASVASDLLSSGGDTIPSSSLSIRDTAGVERVTLGKISATDYGLKVTSSDGSTVIIDGTSNMFKIQATGTMSLTQGTGTEGFTNTTLSALGALTTTPAHLSYIGYSNVVTGLRFIGSEYGNTADPLFAASSSGGSPTTEFFAAKMATLIYDYLDGSNQAVIEMYVANYSGSSKTMYSRYHILKEAGL